MYATLTSNQLEDNLIIPTKKPRIVAAIHPQKETKSVFKTPTKYTSKCVSVDLKFMALAFDDSQ